MNGFYRYLIWAVFCLATHLSSKAQIDIGSLDTAKWEVDTTKNSIRVKPRYKFDCDTSIYFYQLVDGKKVKVLYLYFSEERKYVAGRFLGTVDHPNASNYIYIESYDKITDSSRFCVFMDTILTSNGTKDYCINISSLKTKNAELFQNLQNNTMVHQQHYLSIATQEIGQQFPTMFLLEYVAIDVGIYTISELSILQDIKR